MADNIAVNFSISSNLCDEGISIVKSPILIIAFISEEILSFPMQYLLSFNSENGSTEANLA